MSADMDERADDACNCSALRRAARRVSLLYDRFLAPSGLTSGQYAILKQVHRRTLAPPTLTVLAQALVMDKAALSHTLKPLERDGLIALESDPDDRRARLIRLTPLGRDAFLAAREAWGQAQTSFGSSFGPDQTIALKALLRLVESADLGDLH